MAAASEDARRRWYHFTPGYLVFVLLAVEGRLWWLERCRWMSKGWPAVMAIGALGVLLLLMLLWSVIAQLYRLRFQFGILSLLGLIIAAAFPFGWLVTEMEAAKKQQAIVNEIKKAGGTIRYDFQLRPAGEWVPGAARLQKLLGDDLFAEVLWVNLSKSRVPDAGLQCLRGLAQVEALFLTNAKIGDAGLERIEGLENLTNLYLDMTKVGNAGLEHLKGLTQLRVLSLMSTRVDDAGLAHLRGLTGLRTLLLVSTKVTDAGVKKLQQALPNCNITR